MKKRVAFLALALCLTLSGCKKDAEWTPVKLNITETTTAPQRDLAIVIEGGSGDYTVKISDPAVADVRVVVPDVGFPILEIETRQEGEVVITVTDKKSGRFDQCLLKVQKARWPLFIADIKVQIDTDLTETYKAIEADLAKNAWFPVGSHLTVVRELDASSSGEWSLSDQAGAPLAGGTYTESALDTYDNAFDFYPMNSQKITSSYRWQFKQGVETTVYDVYVHEGKATRMNMRPISQVHFRLYEDLTEYYRAKYPEVEIRTVARAYVSSPGYWRQ
jgi:hypothetical protein